MTSLGLATGCRNPPCRGPRLPAPSPLVWPRTLKAFYGRSHTHARFSTLCEHSPRPAPLNSVPKALKPPNHKHNHSRDTQSMYMYMFGDCLRTAVLTVCACMPPCADRKAERPTQVLIQMQMRQADLNAAHTFHCSLRLNLVHRRDERSCTMLEQSRTNTSFSVLIGSL